MVREGLFFFGATGSCGGGKVVRVAGLTASSEAGGDYGGGSVCTGIFTARCKWDYMVL